MNWSLIMSHWSLLAAMVFGAVGMWLMLPPKGRQSRLIGAILSAVGLLLLVVQLVGFGAWSGQVMFLILAAFTTVSAVATITMRSPVFSAIWFALTLLGTAGLLMLQEAQFLAMATIIVYAGAILVTFLFVLMLAQPEGHAFYDRMSWGRFAPLCAVLAGVLLVGGLTYLLSTFDAVPVASSLPSDHHMARLGGELFSRHLLSVELAGTLLLVALVGAIAISAEDSRRKSRRSGSPSSSERES